MLGKYSQYFPNLKLFNTLNTKQHGNTTKKTNAKKQLN